MKQKKIRVRLIFAEKGQKVPDVLEKLLFRLRLIRGNDASA